jgi:cytoskeletal protein RodZ
MQGDKRQRGKQEAASFGEVLRRERQLRSISLREVAEATKISIRHLEALERNDFAALPGGAFSKGFLRAYATFIGLDPEEMVNHYLFEIAQRRSEPEPEAAEAPESRRRRRQRALLLAVAAAAVLAAVAILLWWGWSGAAS